MFEREKIEALPQYRPRAKEAKLALSGIKVADFTHFVAGPLATMMLADFGADVIKIETPEKGDDFRHYPPIDPAIQAQGAPYLWTNRNKRSVAIDLKTPDGVKVALDLIASADVLMENFSTGVMARFGLDYETCARINPKLIYCSVSAYGREGPYSDRLGFDPIAQAESGFISMNGYPDRQGGTLRICRDGCWYCNDGVQCCLACAVGKAKGWAGTVRRSGAIRYSNIDDWLWCHAAFGRRS